MTIRDKKLVIDKFCKLASKVNNRKFNWSVASDCFCSNIDDSEGFRFDEEVFNFIESAVMEKLNGN